MPPPARHTRSARVGAVKLLAATAAAGIGASLLFQSASDSNRTLVRPVSPDTPGAATVSAAPSALEAGPPPTEPAAPQAGEGVGGRGPRPQPTVAEPGAARSPAEPDLSRPVVSAGIPEPVEANGVVPPADAPEPPPVEQPAAGGAPEPSGAPAPPVEVLPQDSAGGQPAPVATTPAEPAADAPPPPSG